MSDDEVVASYEPPRSLFFRKVAYGAACARHMAIGLVKKQVTRAGIHQMPLLRGTQLLLLLLLSLLLLSLLLLLLMLLSLLLFWMLWLLLSLLLSLLLLLVLVS